MINNGACDQQAPLHPSGNGSSGQAPSLSLAALGAAVIGKRAMVFSPGTGAMAVRTASSIRLYSASLIVLSLVGDARSQMSFVTGLSGSLKL